MGQELTPAQLERLKQQRAAKFKSMGLPATAGQLMDIPVENIPEQRTYEEQPQVVQESTQYEQIDPRINVEIPNQSNITEAIQQQLAEERAQRQSTMYTAPRDKFNALETIKRGAKKQEFKTFMKAESPNQKFQELKVPNTKRKGQPQQQSKSSNAVAPQVFNSLKSREEDMLASLFTENSAGINMSSTGSAAPQGTLIETDENYSNIGPYFDPVAHLKAKAAEKGINIGFSKKKQVLQEGQTPQIFQAGNSEQLDKMMLMMETMMKSQQKTYDIEAIRQEIRTVAKKVAEDTIRTVLKEYLEVRKKKQAFEVVNKEQNVVKIGEKYYQLKPVVPKS